MAYNAGSLTQLLKKNSAFVWDMNIHFLRLKSELCSPLVIKPFHDKLQMLLFMDASHLFGVGYILVQIERNTPSLSWRQCPSCTPSRDAGTIWQE